jgi:hypothetical protein
MFSCTPTSRLQIRFSSFSFLSYCNFSLFNHIFNYNKEKIFNCLPLQSCLILINVEPSINLHDKSHKLSQNFKIPISWVLIKVWYLILEVVSPWRIMLKWKKWNLRKRFLVFFFPFSIY